MKTMLASLLVSDANVLMLDEPTNFLDLAAVEALEGLLKDYPGTVVFVSHDRRLIEEVATRIFHIHEERIEAFDGTYEAYKQKEEKPAVTTPVLLYRGLFMSFFFFNCSSSLTVTSW
ncbi:hypothetical protein BsIDN1_60550 [Bacillus safensis]|uniref:ABC transporter domain-containing protein n=1 Tax=Bacillus safensis TaxID=561879 RepID=A0A5S9MG27_BACIA|nr:hypothetical protein BsIDN1_60550 [Bacillus safensis]